MCWKLLDTLYQIDSIIAQSNTRPVVIFKHSTRCSLSALMKNRVENNMPEEVDFYLLDVIQHRDVSKEVANIFHIEHASPQLLLIQNGTCAFNASHYNIKLADISDQLIH